MDTFEKIIEREVRYWASLDPTTDVTVDLSEEEVIKVKIVNQGGTREYRMEVGSDDDEIVLVNEDDSTDVIDFPFPADWFEAN